MEYTQKEAPVRPRGCHSCCLSTKRHTAPPGLTVKRFLIGQKWRTCQNVSDWFSLKTYERYLDVGFWQLTITDWYHLGIYRVIFTDVSFKMSNSSKKCYHFHTYDFMNDSTFLKGWDKIKLLAEGDPVDQQRKLLQAKVFYYSKWVYICFYATLYQIMTVVVANLSTLNCQISTLPLLAS